nr:unknown [Ipomoea trifida]
MPVICWKHWIPKPVINILRRAGEGLNSSRHTAFSSYFSAFVTPAANCISASLSSTSASLSFVFISTALASSTRFCTTSHLGDSGITKRANAINTEGRIPTASIIRQFICAGSAIITPNPMPTPAKSLPIMSTLNEGATVIIAAPVWKIIEANPIVHFLPMASEILNCKTRNLDQPRSLEGELVKILPSFGNLGKSIPDLRGKKDEQEKWQLWSTFTFGLSATHFSDERVKPTRP